MALAHPEIVARPDRRKPWRVDTMPDPNNGWTDPVGLKMSVPEGDELPQVGIRIHEQLHAGHSPDAIVTADLPRRMAEEIRMDALAYLGGHDVTHRHDGILPDALKASNHPGDEVLWYWQSSLTLGDIASAKRGLIRARKDLPDDLARAFKLMTRRMGELGKPAAEWVAKLLATPTIAVAEQAAAWHRTVRIPDPPEAGEGETVKYTRVQPDKECGGGIGPTWVEQQEIPKEQTDLNDDMPPGAQPFEPDEDEDDQDTGGDVDDPGDEDGDSTDDEGSEDDIPPTNDPGEDEGDDSEGTESTGASVPERPAPTMEWGASQRLRARLNRKETAHEAAAVKEREEKALKVGSPGGAGPGGRVHDIAGIVVHAVDKPPELDKPTLADKGRLRPFNRRWIHDHLKDGHGTPVKLQRGTRAEGSTVLRPERWRPGDRNVFSARRRGGALAIDVSGSMNFDWHELGRAVGEMPGLTVICHASRPTTPEESEAGLAHAFVLCQLSDAGRWTHPRPEECKWGSGNGGDIEALQWLAMQRAPRIWLADGQSHSGEVQRLAMDDPQNAGLSHWQARKAKMDVPRATMISIARTANIVRVRTLADALAICRHAEVPRGHIIDPRVEPERFLLLTPSGAYDPTPTS